MIYSDELLAVAKRIFSFGTPKEALEFPKRFLTYAMTYASDEDIGILRRHFRGERFQASIPQPSPISFLPSIENISEVYRLLLSFESSVPCTDVFTFRVPRQ